MASNPFDQFDQPAAVPPPQGFVPLGGPDPKAAYEAPLAAAQLQNARNQARMVPLEVQQRQLQLAQTQQAMRIQAEAAARAANPAAAQKTDPNSPVLRAARDQLLKIESAYARDLKGGLPNPVSAFFFPKSAANSGFNTLGSGLADMSNAAFRVPGQGAQSDADAARFVSANQPLAGDTEAEIENKLGNLRTRLLANGVKLPAPAYGEGVQADPNARVAPAVAALAPSAAGNATPPTPPSQGGRPIFDPSSGPGRGAALTRGGSATVQDPSRAGVASRVDQMLRSGAPDAAILSYATQVGADPASVTAALDFRRKNPSYRGGYDTKDLELTNAPMSGARQALNLAAQSPFGAATVASADAFTAGTLDNLAANPALARAGMAGLRAQNPNASLAGTIVGGLGAAAGVEMGMAGLGARAGAGALGSILRSPLAADAAFGAATGAGTADDGSRLLGAVTGAGAGVAGGMFGRGLARGTSKALRGIQNADVNLLRGKDVPLTVGQALGGTAKGIEDRLTGVPIVGDMINRRRMDGIRAFNGAAFDEALAPINQTTNKVIGEQGVEAAKQSVSDAYGNALDNVQVRADAPFVGDMRATMGAGAALPDPMRSNIDYTLNTRVGNSFDPDGGLTGRDFQQSIRGLRRDAKAMEPLPYGYDFGQVARQGEASLEGLLQRQSPDTLPAYQAANAANRGVEVVRDAVNRARNGGRTGETGLFAPSQLADAAAANSKRFGNSQGTTRQPMFDLTRAGQNVLPSSVPDSGTAGRLLVQGAGLGALGGAGAGVGYAGGDTGTGAATGLSLAALLALGGTKAGQKQLVRVLADRPEALKALGIRISGRTKRFSGMFGASGALATLPRE